MKRFINPIPNGGLPIRSEDITNLIQNQLFSVNEDYYNSLKTLVPGTTQSGTGIIINSLEIMPGANDSNFTINNTNALVYLNGVLMRSSNSAPTLSFTQSVFIEEDNVITEQRLFADGGIKNATQERRFRFSTIQPLINEYIRIQPSFGPARRIENVLYNSVNPVGSIQLFGTDTIRAQFNNATGLGTGKFFGWAICDGRNGTLDLRSRVPVGWNSGAATTPVDNNTASVPKNSNNTGAIGNFGGSQTATLDETELPIMTNRPINFTSIQANTRVSLIGVQTGSGGTAIAPYGGTGSNALFGNEVTGNPLLPSGQPPSSISANVNTGGGGFGHENRQPYVTVFYAQKIF